jgi:DNA-binding LacI/PurR family transcriptional regulator
LVSDVTNPFYLGIIRGTQQMSKAAGFAEVLIDAEESPDLEADMLHKLPGSLDGANLAASRLSERALIRLAGEIPLVTINRNVRGVPSVVIDSPDGIGQAVEHLLSLGHREIVYVSGPESSWSNQARWQAMRNAGARHGWPSAGSDRSHPGASPARRPPTRCSTAARPPASCSTMCWRSGCSPGWRAEQPRGAEGGVPPRSGSR